MGQDICSNVTCISNCYIAETPIIEIIQEQVQAEKNQTNRQSEQQEGNQSLSKISEKPKIQQEGSSLQAKQQPSLVNVEQIKINQFDIKKELQDLKKIFSEEFPRAIYLTIDKTWQNEMKQQNNDPAQSYILMQSNGNKITYKRQGTNTSKRQILFRQHFPIFGTFYFQIQINSYEFSKGCEFVIGVVNHLQASHQVHSKDRQYEQSFVYRKEKVLNAKEGDVWEGKVRLKLKIDRQKQEIIYQVNDKQEKRQRLKKELINQVASLAPYIQTRYTGVVFSWERAPLNSTRSYKMSTIIEEGSSNITV